MANLKRIRAAAGDAVATAAERLTATAAPPAEPKDDLDDPERQDAILNPGPVQTTIKGGETITLYPLPARQVRQFAGLCGLILADARNRFGGVTQERLEAVLAESADYSMRLAGYAARATFPTDFNAAKGGPTSEELVAEAARILSDATTYRELGDLFDKMQVLNHIAEVFSAPKN